MMCLIPTRSDNNGRGPTQERTQRQANDRKEMWAVHKQLLLKKCPLDSASDSGSDSSRASDDSSSTCGDSSSDDDIRRMEARINLKEMKQLRAKRKAEKEVKKKKAKKPKKNKKKKQKRERD